ncbi:hypothetical protein PPI47_33315, partial [Burkholderia cenocepacia]|nr:hypothetical protein [Burkholderia cenocepacia]
MTGFIDTFTLGGPGPTIAIKDTIDIAGHPTRAASRALADAPPAAGAPPRGGRRGGPPGAGRRRAAARRPPGGRG